jgi:hypothetical protein
MVITKKTGLRRLSVVADAAPTDDKPSRALKNKELGLLNRDITRRLTGSQQQEL